MRIYEEKQITFLWSRLLRNNVLLSKIENSQKRPKLYPRSFLAKRFFYSYIRKVTNLKLHLYSFVFHYFLQYSFVLHYIPQDLNNS